ncbi:MAG: VWA domain-containing protein [Nanoarchaeota archaeon]|nr:VWA domain-containing protein [Nanoarchaeota archaeon]
MNIRRYLSTAALSLALALTLGGCNAKTDELDIADIYNTRPAVVRQVDYKKKSIAFIVDTSGSMNNRIKFQGKSIPKLVAAKESLEDVLKIYDKHHKKHKNVEVGLFYFKNPVTVTKLHPVSSFNYSTLSKKLHSLYAQSDTPLGVSLAYAERELDKTATGEKNIILLTDGMSNSGRNPVDVWKSIIATNRAIGDVQTNLSIVAYHTKSDYFKPLKSLGVTIYDAEDPTKLKEVLRVLTFKSLELPEPAKSYSPTTTP